MAVQLPILQRLNWEIFIKSGIKFLSPELETTFRHLFDLDVGDKCEPGYRDAHAGEKRRRTSKGESSGSFRENSPSTVGYLVEAAHLARNGNVRGKTDSKLHSDL